MRTREEIAENITDTIRHLFFSSFDSDDYKYVNNVIGSELNTYAKEVAIAFAKFSNEKTLQDLNDDNAWYFEKSYGNYETLTDEQLFEKFIQSIKP